MKFSHWPDESCPIFINPSFDEIRQLASTTPDTLRIVESEDAIAVASGYGNTHQSVTEGARVILKNKWWSGLDYILIRTHGNNWRLNHLGHFPFRTETCDLERAKNYLNPETYKMITDFIICFHDAYQPAPLEEVY